MCGRYTIDGAEAEIEKRFSAKFDLDKFQARYNAAPSQNMPVILNSDPKKIISAKWGFQPAWFKKEEKTDGLINARAETISQKPFFKNAFAKNRCLVLSSGFYEWDKVSGSKIPYLIKLKSIQLFAFAGIWVNNADDWPTFAIITIAANELISKIHDRMPVILESNIENNWLDNKILLEERLKLLKSYPANLMEMHPVSRAVNSPANDSPALINLIIK